MKKFDLALILLLSIALRLAVALVLGNQVTNLPGTADQVSYHTLATRILDGHGFTFDRSWWPLTAAGAPTAHWSYLYTLFLVGVYTLFGPNPLAARLIQAILVGWLQPYLAYRLTAEIINPGHRPADEKANGAGFRAAFSRNSPWIAAAITAVYPYFVYYAGTLMTESFFITAVLASFTLAIRIANHKAGVGIKPLAVSFGIAFASAVLLRQLFLLFLPFLFLWLFLSTGKSNFRAKIIPTMVISLAILILAIIPFTIYNYIRFNRFVLLNTNAGFAFFWANHPFYGTEFIPASEMDSIYPTLVPVELRSLDEAHLDQELLKLGIRFVLEDPQRYILLSLSRIPLYFKFWPDLSSNFLSNIARVSSFGIFLPFMLYGILRSFMNVFRTNGQPLFFRPSSSFVLLYLFILSYSIIHILSWVQVRYRLPVDAVLVPFAALAIVDLVRFAERIFPIKSFKKTIYS